MNKGIVKCHRAQNHLYRARNLMRKVRHWLVTTNSFNGADMERLKARDDAASKLYEACLSVADAILKLDSARNSMEKELQKQESGHSELNQGECGNEKD